MPPSGENNTEFIEGLEAELKHKANLEGPGNESVIITIDNLPSLVPRSKFTADFTPTLVKLHGATYNYTILYKHIQRAFLLPKPDDVHGILQFSLI